MSNLVNQHWITIGGEPVTGRIPPRLIVYGPELTKGQAGEVAHIYKLFCDANLVALGDYQVRNRVLSDGSRVRCVSINGVDTVYVWTAEGEEVAGIWGIGIAFTADWAGTPFEQYRTQNEDGQWEPQPLVLTPVARINPTTERYEATGKWRVTKVPKLLGGNKLWVSADKKNWFSLIAVPYAVDPMFGIGFIPPTNIVAGEVGYTYNEDWTPASYGRMDVSYYPTITFSGTGLYAFRANDTAILQPSFGYHAVVFTHKDETEKRVFQLDFIASGLSDSTTVFYQSSHYGSEKKRLTRQAFAEDIPARAFIGEKEPYVEMTINDFIAQAHSLSVKSDGSQALMCGVLRNPAAFGGVLTLDVSGDTLTPTLTRYTITPETTEHSGGASFTLDQLEREGSVVMVGQGSVTSQHEDFVRAYYDLDDNIFVEKMLTTRTLTYSGSGSSNWVDFDAGGPNDIRNYEISGEWSISEAQTLLLKNRNFDLTRITGFVAEQESNRSGTISGNYDHKMREILLYDHINDVVAYIETSLVFTLNFSGDIPDFLYESPDENPLWVKPASIKLVIERGGVVFEERVVGSINYDVLYKLNGQSEVNNFASASLRHWFGSGGNIAAGEPEAYAVGPGAGFVILYGFYYDPAFEGTNLKVPGYPPYDDYTVSESYPLKTFAFSVRQTRVNGFIQPSLRNLFLVKYSRDPITLSAAYNITFYGDPARGLQRFGTTFVCDSANGLRPLNAVLEDLPEGNSYIWQACNSNSLVSI